MYRLIIVVVLLSGCATQNNKLISQYDRNLIKQSLVVSTLGDDLYCSYVGLTIFNNKSTTYDLDNSLNQTFSSVITSQLSAMGFQSKAISRDSLSFADVKKGAKNWANIRFNDLPESYGNISNIIIFDGDYHYSSTGGYYARNNALKTSATLYIYDYPSGRLIGKYSSQHSKLKNSFSCTEQSMPEDNHMLTLLRSSGEELQQELVEKLFSVSTSPSNNSSER
ncbi:MAG: hypothetical protein ACPGJI_00795 [Kangiellaceae bacterium]